MMTDAMKPLGLSFFQLGFQDKPEKKSEEALFLPVGGRLYFDLAHDLSSPAGRKIVLASMGKIDPLVLNMLKSLVKRKDFLKSLSRSGKGSSAWEQGTFPGGWSFSRSRYPATTMHPLFQH
jgi:pyruvate,water dikinase